MSSTFLKGKTVLVTGGTGSFGKAFIRHLLTHSKVEKLIIFSRDELKQSQMQEEFTDKRMRFFIGDVRDVQRLQRAFHDVDIVVHAAALKQVPALEYNPFEAVKTNILGSQNVIEAALDCGVERVLLVSTDKAAQPVNLYGSTKLCAEKLFIAANAYGGGATKFSVVRYGNVMGSRGSVVEMLLKKKNAPVVQITDERMTRFWINLEQAIDLVLFGLEEMEGGEIFIPKVPAMNIAKLFDALAPKSQRKIVGIRPGEKLHEVLLTREEARHAHDIGNYFVVLPEHATTNVSKKQQRFITKGKALPHNFHFSSDAAEHLSEEQLHKLLAQAAGV